MPTAFSIAAVQYTAPAKDGADADASGLRYSKHAKEILPFLVRHRTVLASHVQRYVPHLLKTERDARRHLRTMFFADHINIVKYNDPRQPNVYLITDDGIDCARDFMDASEESIPCRRDDPKGNHILHELLISEVAVSCHEFFRNRAGYEILWQQRFGFHEIPAFQNRLVPDYGYLFRSPHGLLFDFVEVLSGERSITKVKEKLHKYAEWSESEDAHEFLTTLYRCFGSKNPRPAFRLLFVVHNRNLIGADHNWERQVLNATFCVPEKLQQRIWTTTNAALNGAENIDSPIWHCGTDLLPHRLRMLEAPRRQRRKLMSEITLPTHELFTFTNQPEP